MTWGVVTKEEVSIYHYYRKGGVRTLLGEPAFDGVPFLFVVFYVLLFLYASSCSFVGCRPRDSMFAIRQTHTAKGGFLDAPVFVFAALRPLYALAVTSRRAIRVS